MFSFSIFLLKLPVLLLVLRAALAKDSDYLSFRARCCDIIFMTALKIRLDKLQVLLRQYCGQGDVENITLKISPQEFLYKAGCSLLIGFPSSIYLFTHSFLYSFIHTACKGSVHLYSRLPMLNMYLEQIHMQDLKAIKKSLLFLQNPKYDNLLNCDMIQNR